MNDFDAAVEQAKLAAMKELAYGASHEINNPLANVAARAQTLLRDEADPERRRALAAIRAQAMRAHEMISDLMLFARPPELYLEDVDLLGLVLKAVAELADESDRRCVKIAVDTPSEPLVVSADATQLTVAIRALLDNGLEAIGENGRIDVMCRTSSKDDGKNATRAEIEITDSGPGIPPEILSRVFDPFFSGREAGRGLGFGLSKCWRIVIEHGGEVIAENRETGGARFTIRLEQKK